MPYVRGTWRRIGAEESTPVYQSRKQGVCRKGDMARNLRAELNELSRLSIADLGRRYRALTGRAAACSHRGFLLRRVAWHLQADRRGGLSPEALASIQALAESLNPLARRAARARRQGGCSEQGTGNDPARHERQRHHPREIRLPRPGALIRRVYKGREIVVRVLESGFEYEGRQYRSLTAIAKVITSAHWNGLLFFGLVKQDKSAQGARKSRRKGGA